MPAHRVRRATGALNVHRQAGVSAGGVLLALLMVAIVCLLALGAADSSIEPGDGWSTAPAVTAQ